MNEPIISPWLIYLIGLAGPVRFFASFCVLLSFGAGVIAFLASHDTYDVKYHPENIAALKSVFKISKVVFALSLMIAVFIPSKSTIYKMIAASYVTPANIQATGELADKAVDKVIDKIADAIQKFERSEKK